MLFQATICNFSCYWETPKRTVVYLNFLVQFFCPLETWIARFPIGFLLRTILQGKLSLILSRFFLVSWLPVVRELVGLGLTLLTLCLATSLTLITIAIGWIAHRPLLGLTLLAAAAVPILLSRRRAQAANHRKTWKMYFVLYFGKSVPVRVFLRSLTERYIF